MNIDFFGTPEKRFKYGKADDLIKLIENTRILKITPEFIDEFLYAHAKLDLQLIEKFSGLDSNLIDQLSSVDVGVIEKLRVLDSKFVEKLEALDKSIVEYLFANKDNLHKLSDINIEKAEILSKLLEKIEKVKSAIQTAPVKTEILKIIQTSFEDSSISSAFKKTSKPFLKHEDIKKLVGEGYSDYIKKHNISSILREEIEKSLIESAAFGKKLFEQIFATEDFKSKLKEAIENVFNNPEVDVKISKKIEENWKTTEQAQVDSAVDVKLQPIKEDIRDIDRRVIVCQKKLNIWKDTK